MKKLFIYLLLVMVFTLWAGLSYAQELDDISWESSVSRLMLAEHTPLIFYGEDTLSSTGSRFPYSRWMQIGWVPDASGNNNKQSQRHNPEIFRVGIKLSCQHAGSSIDVDFGKIQYAITAADTVTTVTLAVGEGDTTDVGETITGTESFASAVVTAVISGTGGADSIITANYLPGPVFTTSDTVGGVSYAGVGSKISSVTNYFGGVGENADSSSWFCYSGAASLEMYPEYMAEPVSDTSMYWWFPVRAIIGGYMRLYFETSETDTGLVNWTLKCEH